MAHLGLPNSELHEGVIFDGNTRVAEVAANLSGKTAVLFPGSGALLPDEVVEPPETLVVIDGTWIQARKVLERNPMLKRLPRIGLVPTQPGNYRIRKEPSPECVSTIEAVVQVLGQLEREPDRFRPLLRAFDTMIDTQLRYIGQRIGPPRRKTRRHRQPRNVALRELRKRWEDLVAVYAEANAHPRGTDVVGEPEMIHLVAVRLVTGERFEAVIAARRPLAMSAPHHLELPKKVLLEGRPLAEALDDWSGFLRPNDLFCTWGHYTLDLLAAEGAEVRPSIDVRIHTAHRLRRRPGGVERAAELLAAPIAASWAPGRAGKRIVALEAVIREVNAVDGERAP
jgi:hypothetical protein